MTVSEQTSLSETLTDSRATGRYVVARHFVLRMTGFPIELIDALAAPRLAIATDDFLAARQHYVTKAQELLASPFGFSRSTRRKLKHCLAGESERGATPAQIEVTEEDGVNPEIDALNRAMSREASLRDEASQSFQRELDRARVLLYQFAADKRFQEVLLLSSPELGREGRLSPRELDPPASRNSHIRQRELSWISYLQRLTTKNETISFFGPCAWGEFDPQEPAAARIELSEQLVSERVVYIERWVCESLAALMCADPQVQPLLPLHLADDLSIEENRAVFLSSGKTLALSETERELLENWSATVRRAMDTPLAGDLLEKKLITRGIHVALTPFPFRALQRDVARWPDHPGRTRWQQNLQDLERLQEAMQQAGDLESRRASLKALTAALATLGVDTHRNSQALYASRLPINEDCRLNAPKLTLGKPTIDQVVDDAAPWYDLWRDMAGLYATRAHELIRQAWEPLSHNPVPLPTFWPAFLQAWQRLSEVDQEIQQAWAVQLGARSSDPLVVLTEEDTGFLRKAFKFRRMKAFDNLAPDFQIVAPNKEALSNGGWSLLIAEIHPDFASWQHCFFVWCPEPDAYAREYSRQGGQGAVAVVGRYPPYFNGAHNALWVYPYAHQWHFVGVPGPEGAPAIRSANTLVQVTDDDVLLVHTDGRILGSLLQTWNTAVNTHRLELRGNHGHSPRLQVGRTIVQREAWNLELDDALRHAVQAGGYPAYAALREFRWRHRLPEQVFIRGSLPQRITFDKDIKPLFLDFQNPLLVEMLGKIVGRFSRLLVTEMLPRVDECWLTRHDGHYSSEFRAVVLACRDGDKDRLDYRGQK